MSESPLVSGAKLFLLSLIVLLLFFHFTSINETQKKVIVGVQLTDELQDQVADLRRMVRAGVKVTGTVPGAGSVGPSFGTAPSSPDAVVIDPIGTGWVEILEPEADPPRPADDKIDFDAEFRWQTLSEPKGLNIFTSDRDATVANDLGFYLYTPIAERHNANKDKFKPGLAVSCLMSPDKRSYLVRIRQGVYWQRPVLDLSNPLYAWMKGKHEVTAGDIAFSLRMILDERADTDQVRSSFEDIESYAVLDKYTLFIRWSKIDWFALRSILGELLPLPAWIYSREEDGTPLDDASLGPRFASHWFNKNMCGYGAYIFKEYKTSDYIRIERNEDWWGRRPGFKTIYYKLGLRDPEPRYNTFMKRLGNGRRDQFYYPVSPSRYKSEILDDDGTSDLWQELKQKKAYIWTYQRKMYAYTGWTCRGKFFSDKKVRTALSLAKNRKDWQKDLLFDIARFPSGHSYIDGPEYDKSVEHLPFDLERAKKLLDEAGWIDRDGNGVREKEIDGETVEFRFKVIQGKGSPTLDAMRVDWEQALRRIGVVMEPEVLEWSQLLKRVRDREFDAWEMAWRHGDDYDPSTLFHSKLIDTPGSHNYGQWSHPRADEIMDALKIEYDLDKRHALCHELHRLLFEEQPYALGWSWRNPVMFDAQVGGMFARTFAPQFDMRYLYWVKEGPAEYPSGVLMEPKHQ